MKYFVEDLHSVPSIGGKRILFATDERAVTREEIAADLERFLTEGKDTTDDAKDDGRTKFWQHLEEYGFPISIGDKRYTIKK